MSLRTKPLIFILAAGVVILVTIVSFPGLDPQEIPLTSIEPAQAIEKQGEVAPDEDHGQAVGASQNEDVEAAASSAIYNLHMPFMRQNYPMQTAFGVEMRFITAEHKLEEVSTAGTTWVRKNGLLWSDVQPDNPTVYNWTAVAELEKELIDAYKRGMSVILVVRSTPRWAQVQDGIYCGRMKDVNTFASFLEAAVRRYSVPPYNVKHWQIWNEPDVDPGFVPPNSPFGCLGSSDENVPYEGAEFYANLLKASYPRVKAADPSSKVMIGGLLMGCDPRLPPYCTYDQSTYLEGLLVNGAANAFDGIGFHAYNDYTGTVGDYYNWGWNYPNSDSGRVPALVTKTRFIREVLNQYSVSGKFLMATEISLRCGHFMTDPYCVNTTDFDTTKAIYIAQAYAAAIAEGLQGVIWYSTVDPWLKSGLFDDSDPQNKAYRAYAFSRSKLGDMRGGREIVELPGVKGYEFNNGRRMVWVIWSRDGAPAVANLSSAPKGAWDMYGGSVSLNGLSVNVTPQPVYVEW